MEKEQQDLGALFTKCHYWNLSTRRAKKLESLFNEIMAVNFPKRGREVDIQIHGDLRTIKRDNPKKTIRRHTTIIQSKFKDLDSCESHKS